MLHAWLPTWQTDLVARRLRRSGTRDDSITIPPTIPPIILTRLIAERQVVAQACSTCQAAQVCPGLNLAEARQRLEPGEAQCLHVEPVQAKRAHAALQALAQWSRRFTPVTAADEPDGLHLDITGCCHLFGGESALAQRVHAELGHLQVASRIAIAPTAAAAWGLARFAPGSAVVISRNTTAHMGSLPIAALRLEPAMLEQLHEVGIESISHLLEIPRTDLVARYGQELLQRLDAAMNRHDEPPVPSVEPAVTRQRYRGLQGPVREIERIRLTITDLIHQLCRDLEQDHRGVLTIELRLERPRQEDLVHDMRLTAPSRDPRHLLAVLAPTMERLDPGPDGTEGIRVIARREAPLHHRQHMAWSDVSNTATPADDEALDQLVDILRQRCGPESVTRRLPVDAHLPERSVQELPWESRPSGPPTLHPPGTDRPTILFPEPESAHVQLPTSTQLGQLCWRRHTTALIDARGPERITEAWWTDDDTSTRDYWRLQRVDGQWLWAFRDTRTNNWFVHGGWV
ncbi:MAG: DNA polymerase Y family protein [Phycisphaerales bacterium]|nr:DNA polymerase Y family protein [Phycisphaerales bacterium]